MLHERIITGDLHPLTGGCLGTAILSSHPNQQLPASLCDVLPTRPFGDFWQLVADMTEKKYCRDCIEMRAQVDDLGLAMV